MALIKCKECGKEISDIAEKCPNCGNPNILREINLKKKNPTTLVDIIAYLIVFAILLAISFWIVDAIIGFFGFDSLVKDILSIFNIEL